MGYVVHHAIVVTSWNRDLIVKAHALAAFFYLNPSKITDPGINNYVSFFVPPDGSKEGWQESEAADKNRAAFKKYLRTLQYEDGSSSIEWFEASYGGDDRLAQIVDSQWKSEEKND